MPFLKVNTSNGKKYFCIAETYRHYGKVRTKVLRNLGNELKARPIIECEYPEYLEKFNVVTNKDQCSDKTQEVIDLIDFQSSGVDDISYFQKLNLQLYCQYRIVAYKKALHYEKSYHVLFKKNQFSFGIGYINLDNKSFSDVTIYSCRKSAWLMKEKWNWLDRDYIEKVVIWIDTNIGDSWSWIYD